MAPTSLIILYLGMGVSGWVNKDSWRKWAMTPKSLIIIYLGWGGLEAFLEKMGQDSNITIFYVRGLGGVWGGVGGVGK